MKTLKTLTSQQAGQGSFAVTLANYIYHVELIPAYAKTATCHFGYTVLSKPLLSAIAAMV